MKDLEKTKCCPGLQIEHLDDGVLVHQEAYTEKPRWENDPRRLSAALDSLTRRNRRRSQQPFILEESPVDTMADQRTMAKLLRAPTEGYAEAIVVHPILAEQFELKHSLINMMTSNQFFGLEKDNPHDHIRWGSPLVARKRTPYSIHTWEDLVSKFINEFFPPQERQISAMKSQNFQQRFDESFHELGIDTKISFVLDLITVLLNCTNWILSRMP
nr:hypothetical protein [Tanacetum cinerariifolium]